jgi:hypothetical protein
MAFMRISQQENSRKQAEFFKMWPNFFKIGRILSQVGPEGLAVIWQQWTKCCRMML